MNALLILLVATGSDPGPTKPPAPPRVTYLDRWLTDYGKTFGQFEAADLPKLGRPYLNKKIAVRGEVLKVDVSNPKHCLVRLTNGITCDFLTFQAAAMTCKPGSVCTINGILKRHEDNDIYIAPTFPRDPAAPFQPIKPKPEP